MAGRPSTSPQRHWLVSPQKRALLCIFNILPAPNQSFFIYPILYICFRNGEKNNLEMLLFPDKRLDWSYSCVVCFGWVFCFFFTNAWCRTGLEMGLKMMRALSTLSKCFWHLLFCGCHLPRVSGEMERYCFASPVDTGAF